MIEMREPAVRLRARRSKHSQKVAEQLRQIRDIPDARSSNRNGDGHNAVDDATLRRPGLMTDNDINH